MKRILICANPDLNLIDGSSIWSQTFTLALAETGLARVDFIAKSKPVQNHLFGPLHHHKHVTIIDGTDPQYWAGRSFIRLQNRQICDLAVRLHQTAPYDVILVRGYEIACALSAWPDLMARCWIYLTDIPQSKALLNEPEKHNLTLLALAAERILYQSKGFFELWRGIVPAALLGKFSLYSPVIPDISKNLPPIEKRPLRAVYAGKFKGDWNTLEMAQNWKRVRQVLPEAELVMIGDKIHNEPDQPDYAQLMLRALEHVQGLTWLGAMPRLEVQRQLEKARVGLSWRSEAMNETLEYSTKILEYGGAGCAAILNRNFLHEELLGVDYPFFVNNAQEFIHQVQQALTQTHLAQMAAARLMLLAEEHTFSARVKILRQWLQKKPSVVPQVILVAGNDSKYFSLLQPKLEETGKYVLLFDTWRKPCHRDVRLIKRLLEYTDIIICEWCLDKVQWFSRHKRPRQMLVVRIHVMEHDSDCLSQVDSQNIDHLVFTSAALQRKIASVISPSHPQISIIVNLMDDSRLVSEKKMHDARYTLGMIGTRPERKSFDRALATLELLLQKDKGYRLRIKGLYLPDNRDIYRDDNQLEYYCRFMERINRSDLLRYRVIFDPPENDLKQWLSLVGFILAPFNSESLHSAVGEGMLTGCVPVVWNWEGAKESWPESAIVENSGQAADKISGCHIEQWQKQGIEARTFVLERYGVEGTVKRWMQILSEGWGKVT